MSSVAFHFYRGVVKWPKTPDLESGMRWFKSNHPRHYFTNKHKTALEDNSVQRIVSPLRISLLREMNDIDDSLYHLLVDISDYADESSKNLSCWGMCESCRV